MENKGFTLAEILIVLVILAFISTLTLNATSKSLPDRNKVTFKKSYSVLNTAIGEIINDDSLYPKYQNKDPLNPDKYAGLRVQSTPVVVPGTNIGESADYTVGGKKFARLLAAKLQALEIDEDEHAKPSNTNVFVLNDWEDSEDYFYKDGTGKRVRFTTPDGTVWEVGTNSFSRENNTIVIDVNGDKQPNCRFDDEGCIQPDRFTFIVSYDGSVTMSHEKEQEYISSMKITHDEE